ncbi:MAG: hypothetical protein MJ016_07600, partial [Victivallaceae bacterium]|nr:hypothetical protein [Victivallaceae bacterium]
MNILQITSAGAKLCDERGDSAGISLGFSLGQHLSLDFDLRGSAGESGLLRPLDPAVFDVCRSFYFAISNAWNASLPPLFLRTEGISTRTTDTETLLSVAIPDTGTAPLVAALSGKSSAVFTAELSGLDDDGRAVFVWQFQVTISNRIYLGGDAPESIAADPAYLTASEVLARIASASDRAAADAAKTFEIGTVSGGTAAAVSLTAGSTADLALNFVLPRGAIVTTAGEVGIFVDGGSATLVNTITGGTATVGISGGTAI